MIAQKLAVPLEWLTVGDHPPRWAQDLDTPSNRPGPDRHPQPKPLTSPIYEEPARVPIGRLRETSGQTESSARASLNTHGSQESLSAIPLIGRASAGDSPIYEEVATELVPTPPNWAYVQVDGDSADPVIYPGQLAVVDVDRAASRDTLDPETIQDLHDNLVLIRLITGRAMLKRFCRADDAPEGFVLASVNAGRGSPYVKRADIDLILPVVGVIYEDPRLPRQKGRIRRERKHG